MKLKFSLLLITIFLLFSYKNNNVEIIGKYYDIEEENATHYIDFKPNKTYYHYYKNGDIEKSHTGEYYVVNGKIQLNNWEEYSYDYLKKISGFGQVSFGTKLDNHLLYIDYPFLNTLPNDFITEGSYIHENELEEIVVKRKEYARKLEEFKKNKDTIYYPGTKAIKGIGLHCNGYYMPDDREHDLWKYYYETGELESEGNYSVGDKTGLWKFYYKNGNLKELGTFEGELKVGTWEYYHTNGKLKEIGTYVEITKGLFIEGPKIIKSVKRDIWRTYDTIGNLIKEKKFPSREKTLDSLFRSKEYNDTKEEAIEGRKSTIERNDKYYLEYKASLKKK